MNPFSPVNLLFHFVLFKEECSINSIEIIKIGNRCYYHKFVGSNESIFINKHNNFFCTFCFRAGQQFLLY